MSDTYLRELIEEKDHLDHNRFVHSIRLLEDEILRITVKQDDRQDFTGSSRNEEMGEMDRDRDRDRDHDRDGESSGKKPRYRSYTGGVVHEEVVKLSEKVVVPVKEYPKFNFVGKLLGPRGNTLKRLQQATQTRMSVLGRGSTRDKAKEEELRKSDDPKFEHLKEPLHVLIEVEAQKSEAHGRLAAALAEIKKYMVPENDEIRQDQMREMALLNNYENPEGAASFTSPTVISRGRPLPTPIVRVGIPPPGAIILNGQQTLGVRGGRVTRMVGRGRPGRSLAVPRHAAPAPDRYAYDAYDTTYDAAYEGYPDSGEAVYYEYPEDYGSSSSGRRDKRTSFGVKKYRTDPYADVTYPAPDGEYYRSSMR